MFGKKIRKLNALKTGDTIGVCAPSAPIHPEVLERGTALLEDAGFKVRVAGDPTAGYGSPEYLFSSGTVQQRVNALEQLYLDQDVSVVLCARGGYGAIELLPFLSFSTIEQAPTTALIGFSDSTLLLLSILDRTTQPVLHGPSFMGSFGGGELSSQARASGQQLLAYLKGELIDPFESAELRTLIAGHAKGELIGGNLSSIASLIGTPYQPDFSGRILVLEEIGEAPHKVHRSLSQMKLAGIFSGLRGVILGSFKGCEASAAGAPGLDDVFINLFEPDNIPVWQCDLFGHSGKNLPLWLGSKVVCTAKGVEIQESLVNA